MFKNYIKIAWRSLLSNKGFSFINITGLAVGMAAAMLIALWIQNEISFDRFHKNIDSLYVAYNRSTFEGEVNCWSTTPNTLGPALAQEYPEVKSAVRVDYAERHLIEYNGKKLEADGFNADPGFFDMFSFPLVSGNKHDALSSSNHIVISQVFAKKMFGSEDALGKIIMFDNKHSFVVSGVMKPQPSNTRFQGDYITPWSFIKVFWGRDDQNWGNNSYRTFVQLKPGASLEQFNKKIINITIRHSKHREDNEVFLYPLSDYYLHNIFKDGKPSGGRVDVVRLFTIIAGFILLIACINFMNLSTARSEKRAKEVGIRKAVGAIKGALIGQFLIESVIVALISGIIAIVLAQVSLPYFNRLVQWQLSIPYGNPLFWLCMLAFILLTGILAGCYPALYLSSFKSVEVLKGTFRSFNALITPRKLLVIVQFTFAVVMIISTIIIRRQIQYAQQRDNGYDKSNLVYTPFSGDIKKNEQLIKNELLNSGAAVAVSITSSNLVTSQSNSWGLEWQGKAPDAKIVFDQIATQGDFIKTVKIPLVDGRDINPAAYPTDSTACLINESAAKIMNFKKPIGQVIDKDFVKWHVVGVFKDFIWGSPFDAKNPMFVMGPRSEWDNVINYRLNPAQSISASLQKAEAVFKKFNPAFPFNPLFVDQEYQAKFKEQQRTGNLAGTFALLTIIISCLGLFGLAAYMASSRTKEIGVRKVLGASVSSIATLISKDFLKLVMISIFIATPIAWYAMHSWLQGYTYRIEVEWWVFILAGFAAIIIAMVTVSFQSVRAAIANPVKSLRSE
ncbi:ABC transporter permease [Mucilaginibacter sp. PAMB04168]|uniref:ABC transporter permease n=1 Tax=Mucilaginibacter sp. PAMB04168 TaxID=3138567 RepID=UPI0031F6D067